jgi:hypothetical protein
MRENDKSEWGEPGQPAEGGVLPDDQPKRSRREKRQAPKHPPGTGGSNGTPASNN